MEEVCKAGEEGRVKLKEDIDRRLENSKCRREVQLQQTMERLEDHVRNLTHIGGKGVYWQHFIMIAIGSSKIINKYPTTGKSIPVGTVFKFATFSISVLHHLPPLLYSKIIYC